MKKLIVAFVLAITLASGFGYAVHVARENLREDSAAQTAKIHRNIEMHLP